MMTKAKKERSMTWGRFLREAKKEFAKDGTVLRSYSDPGFEEFFKEVYGNASYQVTFHPHPHVKENEHEAKETR